MRKQILAVVILIQLISSDVFSQEMWGAANSNYAGQMGLELNPASIADATYRWELHFLSMDASLLNNYMYVKRNSKLISKSFRGEAVSQEKFTDRYTRTDKFANASVFLKYPSFIWSGKKYAAGFHVSTRAELSATNVPFHLAKYLKEGFDYDPQQNTAYSANNVRAGMLNWHEAGVTFSMVLVNTKESFWTGGVTLNYNYGLSGFFLNLDDVAYIVPADTLLIVDNINASYGHALPDGGRNSSSDPFMKRGQGYSFNAGVQYFKNRNDAFFDPCRRSKGDKPYDYRLGFSLIDIGYIKYNTGTKTFAFNGSSTNWYGIDTTSFSSIQYSDSLLSQQFLNAYRNSISGHSFKMYLPAAASVQFDYAITDLYYVNLTVIQRIPLGPLEIKRSNQIALTPRLETRKLEIAMPFSFYDFFKPRIGFSIRYGIFTIGTDMLSPLVGITDSYGADLYFGIAWRNFKGCNSKGGNRKTTRSVEDCVNKK